MRVIADRSLTDTLQYYETFPAEPTVDPDSIFSVDLPIAAEDRLSPITLQSLLDRLLTVQDRQVLVLCHGTPEGLAVRLLAGSQFKAERDNLRMLSQFGNARAQAAAIAQMPASNRAAAWVTLLRRLRNERGQTLFPDGIPAGQSEAAYQNLLSRAQAGAARNMGLNDAQWGQMLDARNRLRGRLDRIEFRACNTGRERSTLLALCEFFGARQVVAPDVVAFTARFTVILQPRFERRLDQNVRAQTRRMLRGVGRPASIYPEHGRNPNVLPPARSFDVRPDTGNEVFLRLWATSVHPHNFAGWLVAKTRPDIRTWLQREIMSDARRYRDRSPVLVVGLWLRDDQDAPVVPRQIVFDNDPLAPSPPPMPFALPLDPEYRAHLVSATVSPTAPQPAPAVAAPTAPRH